MSIVLSLLAGIDPQSPAIAESVLRNLDVTELIESCLDRANASILHAMAKQSYIHANGFYRISFPAAQSIPARIRFHIWPIAHRVPRASDIPDAHNHKWAFASRILAGGLSHDILKVRLGYGDVDHFRHIDMGGRYELRVAGQATLDLVGVEVTAAGTIYSMDSATVHRVFPAQGQYSCSLVVELAPVRGATDVFASTERHSAGQVNPRRLTAAEIAAQLGGIIDAIGRHSRE